MGLSFTVKEPVQGLSSLAGGMRIHPLVNLSHSIEQAPRRPWLELTVLGFSPGLAKLHQSNGILPRSWGFAFDATSFSERVPNIGIGNTKFLLKTVRLL